MYEDSTTHFVLVVNTFNLEECVSTTWEIILVNLAQHQITIVHHFFFFFFFFGLATNALNVRNNNHFTSDPKYIVLTLVRFLRLALTRTVLL